MPIIRRPNEGLPPYFLVKKKVLSQIIYNNPTYSRPRSAVICARTAASIHSGAAKEEYPVPLIALPPGQLLSCTGGVCLFMRQSCPRVHQKWGVLRHIDGAGLEELIHCVISRAFCKGKGGQIRNGQVYRTQAGIQGAFVQVVLQKFTSLPVVPISQENLDKWMQWDDYEVAYRYYVK